jgi:hypothetical protein
MQARSSNPGADKELAAFHQKWVHQFQAQLAQLSTPGKQVIVENSGHPIDPQAVIQGLPRSGHGDSKK